MPEFTKDFNVSAVLNSFRKSFKYYPIELQLVWLLEILLILSYDKLKGTNTKLLKYHKESGNWTLNQKKARIIIFELTNCDLSTVAVLEDFRNKYVHLGATVAYDDFISLCTKEDNKYTLNYLADFVGVTLNWHCSWYEIFDVEASSN